MITQWQSGETVVGRLRIEGAKVDPTIAQLRLSALLNNAISHPVALPPAAIVLIRKLRDPIPGSLRLNQQHDIRPPPAWQQALTATLDRLTSSAARPALGAVPASAEAVVFLDRSELLACLASDWCEGQVTTRWWWRTFLRSADVQQAVWKTWHEAPEYVPAAVAHLAKRKNAIRFVANLSDTQLSSLFQTVALRFGLHSRVSNLLEQPGRSSLVKETADTSLPLKGDNEMHSTSGTLIHAPWREWVPEIVAKDHGLGPRQQCFLGIALMLQRAPDRVRSSSFAADVQRWRGEIVFQRGVDSNPYTQSSENDNAARRISPQHLSAGDALDGRTAPQQRPAAPGSSSQERVLIDASGIDSSEADTREIIFSKHRSTPAPAQFQSSVTSSPLDHTTAASPREPARKPLGSAARETASDLDSGVHHAETTNTRPAAAGLALADLAPLETQTQTKFGGLFFLINLGIYLRLYGDFSTPEEPGIELNIWDFVALAGQALIGKRVQKDPVWILLARLAQREETARPGSGFEPGDEWRLPSEWLRPFSHEETVLWSAVGGRLRLWHPLGFLVLDLSLGAGSPDEQLERELKSYEEFEFRLRKFEVAPSRSSITKPNTQFSKLAGSFEVKRWFGRLMPYVRARLQRALGLNEFEDPALLVCRNQGRVSVTPAHLDVFFSLEELPVQLRFAGLDRNPGWVPAAGRYIAFHFE